MKLFFLPTILLAAFLTCSQANPATRVVDFSKIPRTIKKEPAYTSKQPLYYLILFGPKAEVPVWFILDSTEPKSKGYDTLYIDLDGDGDLTGNGEKFSAPATKSPGVFRHDFLIGDFTEPVSKRKHTNLKVSWTPDRVAFSMNWLGGAPTMGPYPTDVQHYNNFAHSSKEAPIYVPGHDFPFQFQHWISGKMKVGQSTDFKVFMGNFGSTSNGFFCVNDKFLPPGDYVVATLIYADSQGEMRRVTQDLKSRC